MASGREPGGRLLMVVHNGYPVGEPRVRRQAEAAVAAGWSVDVFALATVGRPNREVFGGVRVFRSRVRRLRDLSSRGMLSGSGRFCLDTFLFCLKAPRYDAVVVANPPDFLVFSAWPPRHRGARITLDVHDLMTDLFAVRTAEDPDSFRMRVLRLVERRSMCWADQVMTVHASYAAEIRKRAGGETAPTVVMNTADEALFTRRLCVPPGPKTIVYHGSMFERYGVLDLLTAFQQVSEADPEARLWMLGGGDARGALERMVRSCRMDGRIDLSREYLPAEAVAERLALAHIGVVQTSRTKMNRYALSTKLFEYVAVGIPVVCAGLPTIREYFGPTSSSSSSPEMLRISPPIALGPQPLRRHGRKGCDRRNPIRAALRMETAKAALPGGDSVALSHSFGQARSVHGG